MTAPLPLDSPITFAQIAKRAGLDKQKVRRCLMRAHLANPEKGILVRLSNAWVVPGAAKLQEVEGWGNFGKRFVETPDAEELKNRVRDQDRQIAALRARVAAGERVAKKLTEALEKIARRLPRLLEDDELGNALGRSDRITSE